ncbi:MAG: WG repeat-containing protein [Saprospiraceae bacterium]|nr:WG repeat-containing protein [Saprospiraceae bacterium]
MKNKIAIIIGISLFLGCITPKDVENLSIDKRLLYPIGENNKWGYANSEGQTVIEPIYEKVEFFINGLASVKINGKYGFIKKDGNWHIKAKYDSSTSFISNWASVSIGDNSFFINRREKKLKVNECNPIDGGGCNIVLPANPNKFFKIFNGKYDLGFKYYVKVDTSDIIEVIDTSNLKIDEIIPYGNSHILIRKNDKYGLFDIWSHKRIIIDEGISSNHKREAHSQLSNLIEFKYDDVIFKMFLENEVSYAKVRIKDKYGVINSRGDLVLPIEFDSLDIKPGWQMALVEFEPNKFGYKKFDGKEFFKRKGNKYQ